MIDICENCGREFTVIPNFISFNKLIMKFWLMRGFVCGDCLLVMQSEYDNALWAAKNEIATYYD